MASIFNNFRHLRPLVACIPYIRRHDVCFSNESSPNLPSIWRFDPDKFITNFDSFDLGPGLRHRAIKEYTPESVGFTLGIAKQIFNNNFRRIKGRFLDRKLINIINLKYIIPIVYCDVRENYREITASGDLPKNEKITNLKTLGLEEDIMNKGWYKLPNSNNPFRVKSINGQLLWNSVDRISCEDMKEIAKFYEIKRLQKRGILINTGVHGDKEGNTSDKRSGHILKEDLLIANESKNPIAIFTLMESYEPVSHTGPHAKPDVDIIDAWCWSMNKRDKNETRETSMDGIEVLSTFDVRIGYASKIISKTEYVEFEKKFGSGFVKLTDAIRSCLNTSNFCYLKGVTGLGKSRVAYEIEKKIKSKGHSQDNEYFDTVFVSFRSVNSIDNFIEEIKDIVQEGKNENELFENYFAVLASQARCKGKKIFVVVDNVDTFADLMRLDAIYRGLKSEDQSSFDLLVTGEYNLEQFTKANGFQSSVIEMKEYCSEQHTWSLFENNFIKNCSQHQSIAKRQLVENNKILKQIFKKTEYHTASTLTLARLCADSFNASGDISRYLLDEDRLLSVIFNIEEPEKETEYKPQREYKNQREILDLKLKGLDHKYGGSVATQAVYIMALLTDSNISYELLQNVFLKYVEVSKKESSDLIIEKFNALLQDLENQGIIVKHENILNNKIEKTETYETVKKKRGLFRTAKKEHILHTRKIETLVPVSVKKSYSLQNNYRLITLNKLSNILDVFDKAPISLELLFSSVIDVIDKQLNQTVSDEFAIYDDVILLLNLFNFAKHLPSVGYSYEMLHSKISGCISKNFKIIKYKHIHLFDYFLKNVFETPGYSIDPVLISYLKNRKLEGLIDDIKTIEEDHKFQNESYEKNINNLILLNNLYVLDQDDQVNQSIIVPILVKYLNFFLKTDHNSDFIVKSVINNLTPKVNQDQMVIIPHLEFHEIPDELLKKTMKWKEDHPIENGKRVVNLSSAHLEEGLRALIYYLLVDMCIEEIDLSHNKIGKSLSRIEGVEAVSQLLKYPSSLRILKLNNNSLHEDSLRFSKILEGLENNRSLEELVLSNNSLSDEHIESLCVALDKHPRIKYIDLSANRFTDKGVEMLKKLKNDKKSIARIKISLAHCWPKWHNGGDEI